MQDDLLSVQSNLLGGQNDQLFYLHVIATWSCSQLRGFVHHQPVIILLRGISGPGFTEQFDCNPPTEGWVFIAHIFRGPGHERNVR